VIKFNIEFKYVGMRRGWIQDCFAWQASLLAVLKFRNLLSAVWYSFPTVSGLSAVVYPLVTLRTASDMVMTRNEDQRGTKFGKERVWKLVHA